MLHKLTNVPIGGKAPVFVPADLRIELSNVRVERITSKVVKVSVHYKFSSQPDPTKTYRCKISFNGAGEQGALEIASGNGNALAKEGTWTDNNTGTTDGSDISSCEIMVFEHPSGDPFQMKKIASLPNVPIVAKSGK